MREGRTSRLKARAWNLYWNWLKWPMPLWRARRRAVIRIAGFPFTFVDVTSIDYLLWAQAARLDIDEPQVTAFLARNLKEGDVYVDVGSYIGGYALLASRLVGPTGRVFALEPDPANVRKLRANLAANGVTNVEVVVCAVTGHDGVTSLDAHASTTSAAHGMSGVTTATTLDAFCRTHDIRPAVVKMDIEGGESDALTVAAAGATFERARAVVVELHEFAGVDPAPIHALAAASGKEGHRLDVRRPDNYNVAFEGTGAIQARTRR